MKEFKTTEELIKENNKWLERLKQLKDESNNTNN